VPIVFTTTEYDPDLEDAGLFVRKVPSLSHLMAGSRAVELDPRLGRRDEDSVVVKKYASAFFATDLADRLRVHDVDTTLIAGCTTSGCIRATAVDAMQNGFRAIVPRQCVGDRSPAAHAANLFDIHAKYGDVVELAVAIGWLEGLEEALP
jgi:nicotinamidase-related amidase